MLQHVVHSDIELRALLKTFDDDVLFRGQVRQYGSDASPQINTSFERQGCIPPLMLRWSHYSRFILAALLGRHERDVGIEFMQAVIQHYGWRSFYLDASSDPAVSAWFASHTFSSKRSFELCEDCFEDPVFLMKLSARYDYVEGDGFIYVLSKPAIEANGLKTFDLSSIAIDNCRPRFHAQSAWLLGALQGNLPIGCIKAVIRAPRSVFKEFAASAGLRETFDLFPRAAEDPVLKLLLSSPWTKIQEASNDKAGIDFFRQAMELPEYDDSFCKHNPAHVAFYRNEKGSSEISDPDLTFFDAPDEIITGAAAPVASKFPRIATLAHAHGGHLVFEIDNLIRRPGKLDSEYVKGIAVQRCVDGKMAVADFVMDHPGLRPAGCGINMGWHYNVEADGTWRRAVTAEDCSCGNDSIHEHHLSGLTIIERLLGGVPAHIKIVKKPDSQTDVLETGEAES